MRLPALIVFCTSLAYSTNYYVKNGGSDAAAGTSDGTAWATLAKVNATTLAAGDGVFLKCGSTWREGLDPGQGGAAGNPVVFSSYGTGAKPVIMGSANKSTTDDWTNDAGNIWKSAAKFNQVGFNFPDVANLVFNGGTSWGRKRMTSKYQCVNQGDFWFSRSDSLVYIYSVGNPASVYSDIEVIGRWTPGTNRDALFYISGRDHIVIDGLSFRYGGVMGIMTASGTDDVLIQNCDFAWIGGALQVIADSLRYGNAVQFWESGTDITMRYCTFDQVYDEGLTLQGLAAGHVRKRVRIHHNLFQRCAYASMSFWIRGGQTSTADSIFFENNTCINLGGWATQRADSAGCMQFKIGYCDSATLSNIFIRNNIFDSALVVSGTFSEGGGTTGQIMHASYWLTAAQLAAITFDNNSYRHTSGQTMFYYNRTNYTPAQFATYQSATGQDAHSRVGVSGFVSTSNFALSASSSCRDAGANLGYTRDILGNPIQGTPDIGAYEYQPTTEQLLRRKKQNNPMISVVTRSNVASPSVPVAIVDSVKTTNFWTATNSWPHTIAAGDNRGLFVAVANYKSGQDSVSAMQLGEAGGRRNMTKIGTARRTNENLIGELWYILQPAVGTDTVLVTMASAPSECSAISMNVTGLHQTTPFSGYVMAHQTNDTSEVTVSSATNELVLGMGCAYYVPIWWNQTLLAMVNSSGDVTDVYMSKGTPATSVLMRYVYSASGLCGQVAVSLKPANP